MKNPTEPATRRSSGSRNLPRASWKGYFRIGDLMVPVRLYGAVRSSSPRFVQLHAADHAPVRRLTVCSKDGAQLSDGDIVRAVEHDGKYIEMDDDALERSGSLERDIVVRQIAEVGDVAAMYYDTPYYLVADQGGELAYAMLRRAFEKTNKIAIVTFLFYGRERLAVVSALEDVLYLQTVRFYDEIMPRSELRTPALPQASPAHVAVASRLLERYSMPFHLSDYHDRQTDTLLELIERKSKGLPLKKSATIPASATPEDEVLAKMEQMLGGDPKTLQL